MLRGAAIFLRAARVDPLDDAGRKPAPDPHANLQVPKGTYIII